MLRALGLAADMPSLPHFCADRQMKPDSERNFLNCEGRLISQILKSDMAMVERRKPESFEKF